MSTARKGRPIRYRRPRDGAKLRAARLRAGLTQVEAAAKLSIPQCHWSYMENGQRDPFGLARRHVRRVARIAGAVGLEAADFLTEKPGKKQRRPGPVP